MQIHICIWFLRRLPRSWAYFVLHGKRRRLVGANANIKDSWNYPIDSVLKWRCSRIVKLAGFASKIALSVHFEEIKLLARWSRHRTLVRCPRFESPLSQRSVLCFLKTFVHRPLGPCKWTGSYKFKKINNERYRTKLTAFVMKMNSHVFDIKVIKQSQACQIRNGYTEKGSA